MTQITIACAKCEYELEVSGLSYTQIQVEPCPLCISRVSVRVAKLRAALDQFDQDNKAETE